MVSYAKPTRLSRRIGEIGIHDSLRKKGANMRIWNGIPWHVKDAFRSINIVEIYKLLKKNAGVECATEEKAGMAANLGERTDIVHEEIEIDIVLPLCPTSERICFHGCERE